MRSRCMHAVLGLLALPCSSVVTDSICKSDVQDAGKCGGPMLSKDQSLLQGRAALHASMRDEARRHEFIEDPPDGRDKEVRRRHLNKVLEQATELVHRGVGSAVMTVAADEMESVDVEVLPEIFLEHKQSALLLQMHWALYEMNEELVVDEAERIRREADQARGGAKMHLECRAEEGRILDTADECEKELHALDDLVELERGALGVMEDEEVELDKYDKYMVETDALSPDHAKIKAGIADARNQFEHAKGLRASKGIECEAKSSELLMQHDYCDSAQHNVEQLWCLVQEGAERMRVKLADGYTASLSGYEAAAANAQEEEAARKAEFGVVEVIRCVKEHFREAEAGSVADPAWLTQCGKAESEGSDLDISYEEPRALSADAADGAAIAPEETPCTPQFVQALDDALPPGVAAASCEPCSFFQEAASTARAPAQAGLSARFWTGFHKGVRVSSGEEDASSHGAHVEEFQKKLAQEGADGNLARLKGSLAQKVLNRLPGAWAPSMDVDLHHGFMHGFEAGLDADGEDEEDDSEDRAAEYLARAAKGLHKALDKVINKAASAGNNGGEKVSSSGFQKASESAEVLPPGKN